MKWIILVCLVALPQIAQAETPKDQTRDALRVDALINQDLNPGVDADQLFEFSVDEVQGKYGLEALARLVAVDEPPPTPNPGEEPQFRLFESRLAFLRFPEAQRDELLNTHREKHLAFLAAQEAAAAQLAALSRQKGVWERLLKGERVEGGVDWVLRIDVNDPNEFISDIARRERFLNLDVDASDLSDVEKAQRDVDTLRVAFSALPAEKRAELVQRSNSDAPPEPTKEETERKRVEAENEAVLAQREREQAVEESKNARTESLKRVAAARVSLLELKEAYSKREAELLSSTKIDAIAERALVWDSEVTKLEKRSLLDGDKTRDADAMYDRLVEELTQEREQLDMTLRASSKTSEQTPAVPELDLPPQVDAADIEGLRDELLQRRVELLTLSEQASYKEATASRDATVVMNEARLRLFGLLSTGKRNGLRGFGADGVRQVFREIRQITLGIRYYVHSFPQLVRKQSDDWATSPVPIVWGLLKLAILIFGFRWWRRRADAVLEEARQHWIEKRPITEWSSGIATTVWYIKRVRRPLEWLLLVFGLSVAFSLASMTELQFIYLIALWSLIGTFVIQLLDGIAERQGDNSKETSALRIRSLRLVGVSVVVVGLMLSLTSLLVGKGAIYGWVISTCWILIIPVVVLLISWWRETIFVRSAQVQNPSALVQWVSAQKTGPKSVIAATIGGVYLLGDGIFRFAMKQASTLNVTRRVLAYLFRREVEKQANATQEDVKYTRISDERYDQLSPSVNPVRVDDYMKADVESVSKFVMEDNDAIVAIIGERGMGKTVFVDRVLTGIPDHDLFRIDVKRGGFDELMQDLAAAIGLERGASEKQIADELRLHKPTVIALNDVHRIIRPLIGGLRDVDRLIEFCGNASPTTSWIVTIDLPAWNYLRRARSGRSVFDRFVKLRAWQEEELAQLLMGRAEEIGISPSFEKLVVPRQANESQVTTEERTRKDYFRILWDYSKGNPAVATHYWRESLFQADGNETVFVRLFKPPAPSHLDDLPAQHFFVLRTIVQLDAANRSDLVLCTDLHPADVADAVRVALSRTYIEQNGDEVSLSLPWFRAVTEVLKRQHLLMMEP